VLNDGTWVAGVSRMRWQEDDGTWWMQVQYRAEHHSSKLDRFPADRVRTVRV
jgi:hypothetical protein